MKEPGTMKTSASIELIWQMATHEAIAATFFSTPGAKGFSWPAGINERSFEETIIMRLFNSNTICTTRHICRSLAGKQ
jgi:hypothetical protein